MLLPMLIRAQEHNVANIFQIERDLFEKEPAAQGADSCVYITCPGQDETRIFAEHVAAQGEARRSAGKTAQDFSLFYVPRRSTVCEQILEGAGVLGHVRVVGQIELDLIPYDNDVLSLGIDSYFRELYLEEDTSSLYYVAQGLMRLQDTFGVIPTIKSKGTNARIIQEMLVRMRRDRGSDGAPSAAAGGGTIDSLLILDRSVDLVTPMRTQLTYEGLIDEQLGIANSMVKLSPETVSGEGAPPPGRGGGGAARKTRPYPLNSDDTLYHDIRNANFGVLSAKLQAQAALLQKIEDSRNDAHSVSQIKDFVKLLGRLQSDKKALLVHINVSQDISRATMNQPSGEFMTQIQREMAFTAGDDLRACQEYLEEAIFSKEPLQKVLRLLCLSSLTTDGLKQREYDAIRRDIIQSYGYPALFALNNLEKVGLFHLRGMLQSEGGGTGGGMTCPNGNWAKCKSQCKLIVDDLDEFNPNDISYAYSGYAPLSVRLVQLAHRTDEGNPFAALGARAPAWGQLDDILPGGPSSEITQQGTPGRPTAPPPVVDSSGGGGGRKAVTVVMFVGGVTYAEVSALRFMSQRDTQRQYVVATTQMIRCVRQGTITAPAAGWRPCRRMDGDCACTACETYHG